MKIGNMKKKTYELDKIYEEIENHKKKTLIMVDNFDKWGLFITLSKTFVVIEPNGNNKKFSEIKEARKFILYEFQKSVDRRNALYIKKCTSSLLY